MNDTKVEILTAERIETLTKGLRNDAVDVKPIDFDFSEHGFDYDGDGEGSTYTFWEAQSVEGGIVVGNTGEDRVRDISDRYVVDKDGDLAEWDEDDPTVDADEIAQVIEEYVNGLARNEGAIYMDVVQSTPLARFMLDAAEEGEVVEAIKGHLGEDDALTIEQFRECADVDDVVTKVRENLGVAHFDPDEYVNFSGPMMNYLYELPGFRWCAAGGDHKLAAALVVDEPVCVVEWEGDTYLALTGGGMDLSDRICAAYMKLGYLPPVHFTDLPRMAGTEWCNAMERLVAACIRSNEIVRSWSDRKIESLRKYAERLAKNE